MLRKIVLLLLIMLVSALSLLGCLQPPEPESQNLDYILEGPEGEEIGLPVVPDETFPLNPAPIPGNCENVEGQYGKNSCAFDTAVEDADVQACLSISELWQKNNCIAAVARLRMDTSICTHSESAFSSDNSNVKYQCIAEVALEVFYQPECTALEILPGGSNWETACWRRVESICNSIPSNDWRELCLKEAAIEASVSEKCMQLHGFERDDCLRETGFANNSLETCDLILDEFIKASCIERVENYPDAP